MTESQLITESMKFAIATVLTLDTVEKRGVLKNQLLRSATSIGANIREAQYASSRADFIAKLQIALKESNESEYWLELMDKTQSLEHDKAERLIKECRRIRFMLISSINTAKKNAELLLSRRKERFHSSLTPPGVFSLFTFFFSENSRCAFA